MSISQTTTTTLLTYLDCLNRILSALIFIAYFSLVLKYRELRTISLLYVHHANFVGFLFILMYLAYFSSTAPSTTNPKLNDLLCQLSEFVWAVLKYLRSYSVLLIAVYRISAVKNSKLFKFLNKSWINMSMPIVFIWITSIGLFLATKLTFRTTHGDLFCIDGYSTHLNSTIAYLTVTSVLGILAPFALTSVIYLLIRRYLRQSSQKFGRIVKLSYNNKSDTLNSNSLIEKISDPVSSESPISKSNLSKNQRLSSQLLALNLCYIMCFSMSFTLSFRYIIPEFNQRFYTIRQVLRILNVFFQTMIPIISIVYNPNISLANKKCSLTVLESN